MGGEKKGTTDTNLEYSKLFGFWVPKNILMGGMLVQLENSDCGRRRRRRRLKWFRAAAKLRVNARHGVCLCYYIYYIILYSKEGGQFGG